MTPERVLLAVQAAAPELGVSALCERARGWSCAVFVSPEGYGVRVPLSAAKAEEAAWSAPLLRRIESRLPFAVPVPIAEVPWVHGAATVFRWIAGAARARLGLEGAAALGDALRAVHALPVDSVTRGLERVPWSILVASWNEAIHVEVLPRVAPRTAASWEALLEAARSAARSCEGHVLVHGDLELDEILWSGPRLVGLTDWDSWLVGDPAWDVRFLARDCDAAEQQAFATSYRAPPELLARARAYAAITPLEDALSAVRGDNDAHVREALQHLEARPRAELR
ncbi:MAG: phosphotransferase [Myxococcales bacterium]|nr:phosphotransferase [Myxococcales bacterium]